MTHQAANRAFSSDLHRATFRVPTTRYRARNYAIAALPILACLSTAFLVNITAMQAQAKSDSVVAQPASTRTVYVVAYFQVRPKALADAVQLFREHTKSSRTHNGNSSFHALQDRDNAATLSIIEVWRDQAALDAHQQTEEYKEFQSRLQLLQVSRTEKHLMRQMQ